MLDNWSYSHTLITCNIYCFSTANIQVFKRTPLAVTLCAHCLSYSHLQHQKQLIRSHVVGKARHIFTFIFNPLLLIPLFFSRFVAVSPCAVRITFHVYNLAGCFPLNPFFLSRFHGILVALNEDNTKGLSLYIHANLIYLHAWEFKCEIINLWRITSVSLYWMAYWEIKENDGEEWVEGHFALRPQLIGKLCAVRTQLDVSQMPANFLGSEVQHAVLTHVNEFSPERFKPHFAKDFVTNYETIQRWIPNSFPRHCLILKYLFAHWLSFLLWG